MTTSDRAGNEEPNDSFWSNVDASGDCWEWRGAPGRSGYGQFTANGRSRGAHREAYELLVGPIPTGLTLDHLCRNRRCVNPDHLEPVTDRENVMRGFSPPAIFARRAHCSEGHLLSPENTYNPPGRVERVCRICRRETARVYRTLRPEAVAKWHRKWEQAHRPEANATRNRRRAELRARAA